MKIQLELLHEQKKMNCSNKIRSHMYLHWISKRKFLKWEHVRGPNDSNPKKEKKKKEKKSRENTIELSSDICIWISYAMAEWEFLSSPC